MTVRPPLGLFGVVLLSTVVWFTPLHGTPPAVQSPGGPDVSGEQETLQVMATEAERTQQWDLALECYYRLATMGQTTPEFRAKLKECARKRSQSARHHDEAFHKHLQTLTPADALNLYDEVVTNLQQNFANPTEATPQHLFASGLTELEQALESPAFRARYAPAAKPEDLAAFRAKLQAEWRKHPIQNPRDARNAVLKITTAAQGKLGIQCASAIIMEFLCGASHGLDEYSQYIPPYHVAAWNRQISGLDHYGIQIRFQDGYAIVDTVKPDSWAALNTPLRPGDRLLRANGRVLFAANQQSLASALHQPIDGGHEFEVVGGFGLFPAPPVRLPTPVPTVLRAHVIPNQPQVGYIRLGHIEASTPAEFDEAISRFQQRNIQALILDLRGNSGGLFTAGVELTQRFLPAGLITTTQGQNAEFSNRVFSSDSGAKALSMPLVVLVDGRTMSSAEIIAAALKDHQRAILIGQTTFGKGAIQHQLPLRAADHPLAPEEHGAPRPTSGELALTIAYALTPRGAPIHAVGVTPDIVEAHPDRQLDLAVQRALDLLAGR